MVPDSVVGKIQYDTMHDEIDRMNESNESGLAS
jgi:hypothetical protein